MKRLIAMLFVGIFFVACSSSREKELTKKRAEIFYSHGTDSLVLKNYTEALTNLLEAVKLDPENADIHNNLGMAYYFKKDRDLARKHLQKAVELNPAHADAMGNLASLYVEDGKLTDAEKIYKIVLKDLTYNQARTYFNLGVIQLKRGMTANAENYFQKSVSEDENFCSSHFELGIISFNKKDFANALQSFKDAGMGVCVDNPAPFYHQALTLIEMKKFTEAQNKLTDLITRYGKSRYGNLARLKLEEIEHMHSDDSQARIFNGVKKEINIDL